MQFWPPFDKMKPTEDNYIKLVEYIQDNLKELGFSFEVFMSTPDIEIKEDGILIFSGDKEQCLAFLSACAHFRI